MTAWALATVGRNATASTAATIETKLRIIVVIAFNEPRRQTATDTTEH
jgi:hypothetical protein